MAAAVLRVLGGDDEARAAQGDEVLERGVETLADVACQSGGGVRFAMGEDLERPPTGGIAEGGTDGIRRNYLRWRRRQGERSGWCAHGEILPVSSLLTSSPAP